MKYYICITPFFPEPDSFRGPYVLDQVRAIERNSDYKVIVMKPCPSWALKEDYEFEGIKVYRFRCYTLPSNMWPNRLCDWLTARAMTSKLLSVGVEIKDIAVAHAHVTEHGPLVNYLKNKNKDIFTIIQHHGFDVMGITNGQMADNKVHRLHCIRYGVGICNNSDLNVGVSRLTLNYVLQNPGIHLKNQYVLHNGVDTSLFYPIPKSERNERFTIGCIGNFWPLKDQMTLIKAIELCVIDGKRDICCIFVGSGATLEGCREYVDEHSLGEYFEFKTEVQHSALPDFYRSLDLFVLPSYWEAFGCVYTEAYACGVPFIGVKGQGISELIPEEDADKWLIEKGDANQLKKLIEREYNEGTTQKLSRDINIDKLVGEFIDYINLMICKK